MALPFPAHVSLNYLYDGLIVPEIPPVYNEADIIPTAPPYLHDYAPLSENNLYSNERPLEIAHHMDGEVLYWQYGHHSCKDDFDWLDATAAKPGKAIQAIKRLLLNNASIDPLYAMNIILTMHCYSGKNICPGCP